MSTFNFSKTIGLIRQTETGYERNMYAHLRDLFVHVLGHPSENIIIDSPQEGAGGNSPDLAIRCYTGLVDAKERATYHDWIVVEAKGERNVFSDSRRREEIFSDKQKYVRPETEWFVMADPECLVIRPIAVRNKIDTESDKVFKWDEFNSAADFRAKLADLHSESAADSPALTAFRQGDESRIAAVKVDVPDAERAQLSAARREQLTQARKDFLKVVRDGTRMLQRACEQALLDWAQEIAAIKNDIEKFENQWGECELTFNPLVIKGANKITSSEDKQAHDAQARELKKTIKQNITVAKLALVTLPAYYARSDNDSDTPFATESANLILARVLLLRFFEDHNFFNNKKYVCNGGVKALQQFMRYYDKGYEVVLRAAYEKGGEIYGEVFDETGLDWILNCPSNTVSRAIELTMMWLSRFDFSTISGDILTGIYDRFLDKEQRKTIGEFYTPPSVARYIVRRLNIQPTDSVFDPACGSGTFLLEAFEHITGGDIRNGRGDYTQAAAALTRIGGNDINPFSAVMTQIQILWHLLPLKSELKEHGFPDILVSGGIDAIAAGGNMHEQRDNNIYADLSRPVHDAVIGNPPYVRPERSGEMDADSQRFFSDIGGANKNFYDLFVYKALHSWCRTANEGAAPGRLGFVLPLSFCDSKNSSGLRRLFALGGRFRLLEIVDMEMIAPLVFDAAVNPIVLLAEKRPAAADDKITLRIAGDESVIGEQEFDLSLAPASVFEYADVFSEDGRILSKLSVQRKRITDKMRRAENTLTDIARVYYAGVRGNRIEEWREMPPEGVLLSGDNSVDEQGLRWQEKRMLGMGAAARGQYELAVNNDGLDYYKGENISTCMLEGDAAMHNILSDSLDDASFWRYRDILPNIGYAFLRIALSITAARFNPHQCAFLNTATLLFPNAQWEQFPLDIALASRLYQFYYACYLREGAVSQLWSNMYPRTLEKVPLPPALLADTERLNKLRESYLYLCEAINRRADTIARFLQEVATAQLKDVCRENELNIQWSENLDDGQAVKIDMPTLDSARIADNRLLFGEEWLAINNADVMRCLAAALTTQHGRELKKADFQKMPIPYNTHALEEFEKKVRSYDSGAYDDGLEKVLAEVDAIVGKAFGLSAEEIEYVQQEMQQDSFLRRIYPKMPFVERRRRGLSDALADSGRYERG